MRRNSVGTKTASEPFDPALWSVAAVLSAAVVYLACLT
jgi:hypothetical protein